MAGIPAFGTILQMGDGATPTEGFADIAEIADIPGLSPSINLVDDTVHNNASAWRHRTPTLFDGGKIALRINYDPTEVTHGEVAGLAYVFRNRQEKNYRLVFNVGAGSGYYQFPAIIESMNLPNSPIDGIYSATVNFQVNDEPVWT